MNKQEEAVKLYEPKVSIAGNLLPSHEIEVLKLVVVSLISKVTQQIQALPDNEDYHVTIPLLMNKRRKILTMLELLEGGCDYVGVGRYSEPSTLVNDFALSDSDVVVLRIGCDAFQRECRNSVHQKTAWRLLNQLTPKP